MTIREQWTAPATPADVATVRRAAVRFAELHGIEDPPRHALNLALAEALSNAAIHAYDRGPTGRVSVDMAVDWDSRNVHVRVCDDGHGMVPRSDSPGMGLGMPLMATLADELHIGSQQGGSGTEVAMTFMLEKPPGHVVASAQTRTS